MYLWYGHRSIIIVWRVERIGHIVRRIRLGHIVRFWIRAVNANHYDVKFRLTRYLKDAIFVLVISSRVVYDWSANFNLWSSMCTRDVVWCRRRASRSLYMRVSRSTSRNTPTRRPSAQGRCLLSCSSLSQVRKAKIRIEQKSGRSDTTTLDQGGRGWGGEMCIRDNNTTADETVEKKIYIHTNIATHRYLV